MTHPLDGRAAIITGASQGLGVAIARAYVRAGAGVLLCARDEAMLAQAREQVAALAGPAQTVEAQVADVSNDTDADRLVDKALQIFPSLQILVNNAGVYGPMGYVEETDWGAWVKAVEINLLGSVRLCRAVLPHFKRRGYGKIVQISGGGATNPLPRLSAYAASKAAVVRFIETVAEEVREQGIDMNAIAPGPLNTRLLDEVLAAGPEGVGRGFFERAVEQKRQGGVPLENGAALAVFLGSGVSDGISGKLISAIWDEWEGLPDHLSDLTRTDVYTLRRIVPRDRGLEWGTGGGAVPSAG